jgi:hypothetical protein
VSGEHWPSEESGLSCLCAVNDTIALVFAVPATRTLLPIEFVCECGLLTCTGFVRLTLADYGALRGQAGCFVVGADHHDPAGGTLVAEQSGYVVLRLA